MQRTHTYTSISKNICISVLLLLSTTVQAQIPKKIFEQPKDSTRFLRHVAVSADLVGPLQLLLSDYGQYEAAARVSLRNKYFPVVELGYGQADSEDITTHLHYTCKAPYGRIGLDVNMLKNKDDDYRLYVGARYGYTSFKYTVNHPGITDPVYDTQLPFNLNDISNQYHWLEAVMGVDVKLWGPLRMGWSVRYKHRIASSANTEAGNPWYVPGFGKPKATPIGGTFLITVEI